MKISNSGEGTLLEHLEALRGTLWNCVFAVALMLIPGLYFSSSILQWMNTVPELPGFELVKSVPIRFTFTVEGQQIRNLFSMTPHVFRIGKEGAERLRRTETLTDTASCVLNVFRRA